MHSRLFWLLVVVIALVAALGLRLPRLAQRPMHTDESIHADKFNTLWQEGRYEYDPQDFHGPTIYYAAVPIVWLSGARTYSEMTETMFRLVPVIFGAGLVILTALAAGAMGRPAAAVAALLVAISPAMVFYSRYYIQEMLLVFFTFAAILAGYRHLMTRRILWAVACGAALGLMHATKETAAIAWVAMTAAGGAVLLWITWAQGRPPAPAEEQAIAPPPDASRRLRPLLVPGIVAFIVLLVVSGAVVSNGFTHPRAVLDSWLTYLNYARRAGGAQIHDHPWPFYLQLLAGGKWQWTTILQRPFSAVPAYSEAVILILAAVGFVFAMVGRGLGGANVWFLRFLAIYTVALTVIYSIIPYKTPWCALGFLHGMILLAGVGAAALIRLARWRVLQVVAGAIVLAPAGQLGWQAYTANFRYPTDRRNPYVYAHPSNSVLRLVQRIGDFARFDPLGRDMLIQVITSAEDCWPLPWYLRHYTRVGYPHEPPPALIGSVLVLSGEMQEALPPELAAELARSYTGSHFGLRPGVVLQVYARNELWQAWQKSLEGESR